MPTRKETAAAVSAAVDDALERGECDEALRLAEGHPDKKWVTSTMERISRVREGGTTDEGEQTPPEVKAGKGPKPDYGPVPMFLLAEKSAKVKDINPRVEKHGNASVQAMDISFLVNMDQEALDVFDPMLRKAWFFTRGNGSHRDLGDHGPAVATDLRFPRLVGPHKWNGEYPGYALKIFHGSSLYVEMLDTTLKNIKMDPTEGGRVLIEFQVACHPDADIAGRLTMINGEQRDITLTPPIREADLIGDGGSHL